MSEGLGDLTKQGDLGNVTHAASLSETSWVVLQTVAEVVTYQGHLQVARYLVASRTKYDDSVLTDLPCSEEIL